MSEKPIRERSNKVPPEGILRDNLQSPPTGVGLTWTEAKKLYVDKGKTDFLKRRVQQLEEEGKIQNKEIRDMRETIGRQNVEIAEYKAKNTTKRKAKIMNTIAVISVGIGCSVLADGITDSKPDWVWVGGLFLIFGFIIHIMAWLQ